MVLTLFWDTSALIDEAQDLCRADPENGSRLVLLFHICVLLATDFGIKSSVRADKKRDKACLLASKTLARALFLSQLFLGPAHVTTSQQLRRS